MLHTFSICNAGINSFTIRTLQPMSRRKRRSTSTLPNQTPPEGYRLLLLLVERRVVLPELQTATLHAVGGPLGAATSATVRPVGEPALLPRHHVEPVGTAVISN